MKLFPCCKYLYFIIFFSYLFHFSSKFYIEMTEQNDIIGSNTNYSSNSNYSRNYSSITPSYFYKILEKFNPQYNTLHIYQEDAHEFLYFLLDKMHEEFLSINNLFKQNNITGNSNTVAVNNDDEWEEVGKGNKSSIIVTVCYIFIYSVYIKCI